MKEEKNGSAAGSQGPYYNPAYYAQNLCRYRQVHPPGGPLFKVEAFDYLLISLLRITCGSEEGAEIEAVHVDGALPLLTAVENTPAFVFKVRYPLTLAPSASLSLLLNDHAAQRFLPLGDSSPKPLKVIVTMGRGLAIFEQEGW